MPIEFGILFAPLISEQAQAAVAGRRGTNRKSDDCETENGPIGGFEFP
jgi:hypothetical protein